MMWVAEFDTRHFTFTAYGTTRAEALAAMASGWAKWVADIEDGYSIEEVLDSTRSYQVKPGGFYLSGDKL